VSAFRSVMLVPLLLCSTTPLSARVQAAPQRGGSILLLLPVEGKLEVGQEVKGALSTADYQSHNDAFVEAWTLEGQAGNSVVVDLISDDFDAILYVIGPGLRGTLTDDDGAGACNARVAFTFLENGTFRVIASSVGSEGTGIYTLRVSDTLTPTPAHGCGEMDPERLTSLPTADRAITVGDTKYGQLAGTDERIEDGRYAQAWALEGEPGQTVVILLESDDFDAYLYLIGPGFSQPEEDDDSAGDLNAELTVTFPEGGRYLVIVSALSAGDIGQFTLSVRPATEP